MTVDDATKADSTSKPDADSRPKATGQASQSQPTSSQPRSKPTTRRKTRAKRTTKATKSARTVPAPVAKFPRHAVERALRIPRAILDQNAGHETTPAEAARFLGGKVSGEFRVEISSGKKYGFLVSQGDKLALTDRAKRALRPQTDTDELESLRQAVLGAPDISEVYSHYRGEYLPDEPFFSNALTDNFKIPLDKVPDFIQVFNESLASADLIDSSGTRPKLIDIGRDDSALTQKAKPPANNIRTLSRHNSIPGETCFVMQPFAPPYGGYYDSVFKPAIEKAGLTPIRADAEIFGAGKVMDQVWSGIGNAKVLVAELTTRNANVYYELGLAHALGKPVVLVAADGEAVPFDVQHIRVVYYDVNDPFWGQKLIDKVAENIRSALVNPAEAIFSISDATR